MNGSLEALIVFDNCIVDDSGTQVCAITFQICISISALAAGAKSDTALPPFGTISTGHTETETGADSQRVSRLSNSDLHRSLPDVSSAFCW